MAEKQLKSLTFHGLDNTYVILGEGDVELEGYYGHEDADETNLNTWLDTQLTAMTEKSLKHIRVHCYPAVSGTTFYGHLANHVEGYATLFLTNYDKDIMMKSRINGVWSESTIVLGNKLEFSNNLTEDIQAQFDAIGKHVADKENPHEVTIEQIGAAPAGYGLGGEEGRIITSANTALRNGWYNVTAETLEIPIAADGILFVASKDANSKHQTIYYANENRTICHRTVVSGYFQPWDYENPPMQVGVEYRTTERRIGKTVYAKRISYTTTADVGGSGTVDLNIPHGISSWGGLVRCICTTGQQPLPAISSSGGLLFVYSVNSDSITIRTYNFSLVSGLTLTFDLYYTKN